MSTSNTWRMMVSAVRRSIRLTQPPLQQHHRRLFEQTRARRSGLSLEDHYALLLAAQY